MGLSCCCGVSKYSPIKSTIGSVYVFPLLILTYLLSLEASPAGAVFLVGSNSALNLANPSTTCDGLSGFAEFRSLCGMASFVLRNMCYMIPFILAFRREDHGSRNQLR